MIINIFPTCDQNSKSCALADAGHLKEYHQKIERGELQLPSVSAKYDKEVKEDIEERKRRRRDKSDLFRRIKMLEEMDSD